MLARMQRKVVVVTGASSGIGAVLAEQLGARGTRVVLVARREDRLRAIAAGIGERASVCVADVTKRTEVERVVDHCLSQLGGLDVWVNNAGRGITRLVSELSDADFDEMMLVNVKSALYGMQAVLPHFRSQGRGHIINVSSMLGRIPMAPVRSAYAAAKHALNSLTANMRMELAAFPDIHVTAVHPGVVATDFGLHALHGGLDSRNLPGAQKPEEVAALIVETIEQPRADVYTRPEAKQMVLGYYGAADMASVENQMPFQRLTAPPSAGT
jgi:NAD(P)-dependent dehydrogenase (short-subunit alcohol dehydrogenase family)